MFKHAPTFLAAGLAIVTLLSPAPALAQREGAKAPKASAAAVDPWVTPSPKLGVMKLKIGDPAFTVDYPKKDWVVVPGGGVATVVLAQNKGLASVIIERVVLKAELGAADITDLFAQLETEAIQQRAPKAADFNSKVLDVPAGRLVAVQYVVNKANGPERVRQYSIPLGTDLVRLTCSAPLTQFQVFDPVFAHMAASFSPARTE